MEDRRVHARLHDGREIVRYDRAGKWRIEGGAAGSYPVDVATAARLAVSDGCEVFPGRLGGGTFDRLMERALREGL